MNDELRRFVDLIDAGQRSDAEAWAMGRAKDGDADGQFLMGYLLFWRVDFRKACDWFHRAAAQDHPEALFQLSRIDQSEDRANWGPPLTDQMRTYLRRAADLGSVEAWTALARFLANGSGGFAKNEDEAKSWYEKAANAGDVEAESGLAWMLMRRTGDPGLVAEGVGWLEKAASHDTSPRLMERSRSSEALSRLVQIYTKGFGGVSVDLEKAAGFSRRIEQYRARVRATREAFLDSHPEFQNAEPVGAVSTTQETPAKRAFAYQNASEAKTVLRTHMATYRQQTHKDPSLVS